MYTVYGYTLSMRKISLSEFLFLVALVGANIPLRTEKLPTGGTAKKLHIERRNSRRVPIVYKRIQIVSRSGTST